jgi:hypothetical protein
LSKIRNGGCSVFRNILHGVRSVTAMSVSSSKNYFVRRLWVEEYFFILLTFLIPCNTSHFSFIVALILSELNIDTILAQKHHRVPFIARCAFAVCHCTMSHAAQIRLIYTHTHTHTHEPHFLIFHWADSLKLSAARWMLVDFSHSKVGYGV